MALKFIDISNWQAMGYEHPKTLDEQVVGK